VGNSLGESLLAGNLSEAGDVKGKDVESTGHEEEGEDSAGVMLSFMSLALSIPALIGA